MNNNNNNNNNNNKDIRNSVALIEENTICMKTNHAHTKHVSYVYINVRENRRNNQEWTIQRNWHHWAHNT